MTGSTAGPPTRIWIRHETRPTERRAPVVPADAATLVRAGLRVTVEESARRAFPAEDYAAAGCEIAPAGGWQRAPADSYVLGLKELPDEPPALIHRHIFFGHAYKGQRGATALLRRLAAGGGTLLDLESLVDGQGRRLVAFGYWAGYVGAALAVLAHRRALRPPLRPLARDELDAALRDTARTGDEPRALVIGALGRCGRGARDALAAAGIEPTCWDLAETRDLDREALAGHDLLVNTVLSTRPVPPFLTRDDLRRPGRRLSVVSDVSCDVTSDCNVLPIYRTCTSWERPVRRLSGVGAPLSLIAIDNLPSLLPAEASVAFSADLTPLLAALSGGEPAAEEVWRRCTAAYHRARAATGVERELTDA